jgi:hypothetical protein
MSRTVAYIINEHPYYMRMAANSIIMLRKYNQTLPVRVVLVEDEGQLTQKAMTPVNWTKNDFLNLCRVEKAEVIRQPPISKRFRQHMMYLGLFAEPSIFCLDADTYIYADIGYLMDKYESMDLIAPYSNWMTKSGFDPLKILGDRNIDPMEIGITLWNNGNGQKFANGLSRNCQDLLEMDTAPSEWIKQLKISNTHLEQVAMACHAVYEMLDTETFNDDEALTIQVFDDIKRHGDSAILHSRSDYYEAVMRDALKCHDGNGNDDDPA